jgi:hypothetical protein
VSGERPRGERDQRPAERKMRWRWAYPRRDERPELPEADPREPAEARGAAGRRGQPAAGEDRGPAAGRLRERRQLPQQRARARPGGLPGQRHRPREHELRGDARGALREQGRHQPRHRRHRDRQPQAGGHQAQVRQAGLVEAERGKCPGPAPTPRLATHPRPVPLTASRPTSLTLSPLADLPAGHQAPAREGAAAAVRPHGRLQGDPPTADDAQGVLDRHQPREQQPAGLDGLRAGADIVRALE